MPLKDRNPEWWGTEKGRKQLTQHLIAVELYRRLGSLEETGKVCGRSREWVRIVLILHGIERNPPHGRKLQLLQGRRAPNVDSPAAGE